MQKPVTTRDHKITQDKHGKKRVRLVGGKKPPTFNGECLKMDVRT